MGREEEDFVPAYIQIDDHEEGCFVRLEDVEANPVLQGRALDCVLAQLKEFQDDNRYILNFVDPQAAKIVKELGERLEKLAAKLASSDQHNLFVEEEAA